MSPGLSLQPCSLSSSSPTSQLPLPRSQSHPPARGVQGTSHFRFQPATDLHAAGTETLELTKLCLVKDFISLSQERSEKMVHVMFVGEGVECSRGWVPIFKNGKSSALDLPKTPLLSPRLPSQG